MKKNEENVSKQETKLIWKMKELPTADSIGKLVDTKVITPEEARAILFKEEVKQSDEVEALKEMVESLKEMVQTLIARNNSITLVPYTRVVEVPAKARPYWDKYWSDNTTWCSTTTESNGGYTTYSLSIK